MKVSWKKTTKKKRCLEALPQFTDLPFEHNQDEHPLYPQPHPEHSHGSEEARQLAKEFQAQGDKLALCLGMQIQGHAPNQNKSRPLRYFFTWKLRHNLYIVYVVIQETCEEGKENAKRDAKDEERSLNLEPLEFHIIVPMGSLKYSFAISTIYRQQLWHTVVTHPKVFFIQMGM
nr:uncharacterized protein LOC112705760 isoform X2 [Arachis hypogaea]